MEGSMKTICILLISFSNSAADRQLTKSNGLHSCNGILGEG
ncbi:Uncharacterized protein APZ42_023004 [Daphnia magna]|uniref:Uncharacterized protein n=1 Tax=Daphnia magna TaxID=35525 RepID=A0A164VD15_9CRUS|nr:Uncharacterized protein APZ42_023004 [Daphnia magna]